MQAQVTHVDGKKVEQMNLKSESEAQALSQRISGTSFQVRHASPCSMPHRLTM